MRGPNRPTYSSKSIPMNTKEQIVRLFEAAVEGNHYQLSNCQVDVYTAIAKVAHNADNLNDADLDILRKMATKGHDEPYF